MPLQKFINENISNVTLEEFCALDDADVMMAIKTWCQHTDKVLSILCNGIMDRQLLKLKYVQEADINNILENFVQQTAQKLALSVEDAQWLVFSGVSISETYKFDENPIKILFKNGDIKDISQVNNPLINESLRGNVKKHYICYISIV
jgi:uncharacterized protein